jgi:hypothetical protein
MVLLLSGFSPVVCLNHTLSEPFAKKTPELSGSGFTLDRTHPD